MLQAKVAGWLQASQEEAVITVEESFPGAMLSVLSSFSCFETVVSPGKQKNTLQLRVLYQTDEREYVLQKIRFLGRRVTVEAPVELRERMRQTAEKALARYGE